MDILKNCIAYEISAIATLRSVATGGGLSFFIKRSSELKKLDLEKLERLTLHKKSMMSSFIQNAYIGNIEVPAIVAIAQHGEHYVGWALLQFNRVGNEYVKSIDVFVDDKYRSTGVGSKLVSMAKSDASLTQQINGIPVQPEPRVGAWDEVSRKFYQKHKLEGDVDVPPPASSRTEIKPENMTELDDMFGELDQELQQSASFKRFMAKYS